MRFILLISASLLSYTCGAPSDFDTLTDADSDTSASTDEDTSKESDGSTDIFGYSTTDKSLPPIVTLPESDKKILCNFVGSFQNTRMEIFSIIMNANFMFDAEKYFTNKLREIVEGSANGTNDHEYFGIDKAQALMIIHNKTAFEIFSKENIVKAHTLNLRNTILQGMMTIYKELLIDAKKVKNSLSKETAESEQEFLSLFEYIKTPTYEYILNYPIYLANILNRLEPKVKHRYQCLKKHL